MVSGADTLNGGGKEREDVGESQAVGYNMTTMKVLRSLIVTFVPAVDWPLLAVGAQSGTAIVIAYFSSMNLALQLLLSVIGLHLLSSLIVVVAIPGGKGVKEYFTDIATRGIAIILVATLGSRPELELRLWDHPVSAAALIGGFIIFSEVIEFDHDMEMLGMRVLPLWVRALFQNAKDGMDNGGSVSILTSLSRRSKDGVEVVSKTETVVTEKPEV